MTEIYKECYVFQLKTIQSFFRAENKKLLLVTFKCQSNKEKIILYCLMRLIHNIAWKLNFCLRSVRIHMAEFLSCKTR